MARQPESRLQLKIQKAIRAKFPGAYVRKIWVGEFQTGGIADLICCIKGFFFAIEVKVPGEEDRGLSELQREERNEVLTAGGAAFVVTSSEQAIDYIQSTLWAYEKLDRKTSARATSRR